MNEPRTQKMGIYVNGSRSNWDCRDADIHVTRTCDVCGGARDECAPDDIRCEWALGGFGYADSHRQGWEGVEMADRQRACVCEGHEHSIAIGMSGVTPGYCTRIGCGCVNDPKTPQATHASELVGVEQRELTAEDERQLDIAKAVAAGSSCMRRATGCTVTINGRVVTTGYNGTEAGQMNCGDGGCPRCRDSSIPSGTWYDECLCVHCEEDAIAHAARMGISLDGGTMYISSEGLPQCKRCARLVRIAGIVEVVLG